MRRNSLINFLTETRLREALKNIILFDKCCTGSEPPPPPSFDMWHVWAIFWGAVNWKHAICQSMPSTFYIFLLNPQCYICRKKGHFYQGFPNIKVQYFIVKSYLIYEILILEENTLMKFIDAKAAKLPSWKFVLWS